MQKPCTYACRRGKGQFAALGTAQRFACGNEWFLQMDVRKYFDSIPKALMLERGSVGYSRRDCTGGLISAIWTIPLRGAMTGLG